MTDRIAFALALVCFILHKVGWLIFEQGCYTADRVLLFCGRQLLRVLYYGGWTELTPARYAEALKVNGG
jgi:hypothetical protein